MNGSSPKTILIMAGGTGGHIFPGLAVAQALHLRGWHVHWLGVSGGMEANIVPKHDYVLTLKSMEFSGIRGKGFAALMLLPLRLLRACWQALTVLRRVRPDVVLGMGGYVAFPGGIMASMVGIPLVLHEQNAVAGLVNRVLSGMADGVFTAFPDVFARGQWVGNPVRQEFTLQDEPGKRFATRTGPLRLLVVGGSLGAQALNETVPRALALLPPEKRPVVTHQSGTQHIDALRRRYDNEGVQATLVAFIDQMATAYAEADLVVCRAGASTVSEIAAVGAAAVFVPLPHAVDDHQSANARFLVNASQDAGWLVQQQDFTPQWLAQMLLNVEREGLFKKAHAARQKRKVDAALQVANACVELAG